MQEIQAIIKKYDIAASVCLHRPGFTEYLNEISPSWSCLSWEPHGIRIRATIERYQGKKELRDAALQGSANMIHHFEEHGARLFQIMEQLSETLKAARSEIIPEEEGGLSSHEEQNN